MPQRGGVLNPLFRIKKTIKLVNDELVITECQGSYHDNEDFCNGTWIRQ
jgi:hypothetical protein